MQKSECFLTGLSERAYDRIDQHISHSPQFMWQMIAHSPKNLTILDDFVCSKMLRVHFTLGVKHDLNNLSNIKLLLGIAVIVHLGPNT